MRLVLLLCCIVFPSTLGCSPVHFLSAAVNAGDNQVNAKARGLLREMHAVEDDPSRYASLAFSAAETNSLVLWGWRGHRARGRLLRLARHPDFEIAMNATFALPGFGVWAPQAVPRLVDLGARATREDRLDSWGMLGLGITTSSYMTFSHPVLWVMATHPDPTRRRVATALMGGELNRSILGVPRLSLSLLDPDPKVRATAAKVLGVYQYRGLPALPALMLSERLDPAPRVRENASDAAHRIWKKGV